ncbi:MAG TPA: diacylglycerol kinase family protein, partial [Thermoanaerobaculia bacterium]|nr:diacylglycerol kinase family protein [Thermoanaerobaculia bacterium]
MPSPKGTLFFNPSSGVKLAAAELVALQDAALEAGLEVIRLTRDVDITRIVRERMERGQRLFIAAGGDGTIN